MKENKEIIIDLGKLLLKYAFPLFCETGVEDYEIHFIGSSFILRYNTRFFSIFTNHQYKLANDKEIFTTHSDTEKGLAISRFSGGACEGSDLAIFEIPNPSDSLDLKKNSFITEDFIKQPKSFEGHEMFMAGYPRLKNQPEYSSKILAPFHKTIVFPKYQIRDGLDTIYLNLAESYSVSSSPVSDESLNDLVQGFSGSPVFGAFENEKGQQEAYLLGVASYASENPPRIHVVRTYEILTCLNNGFEILKEFEN